MAEELTAVSPRITLCHESFGDPTDPAVLLVMGLGTQMLGWHDDFCRELAGRGFHVVRFDNRDCGRSTHLDFPPPSLVQLAMRRFDPRQYRLEDMADDTAALVGELELGRVHLVGASMGGMIAQLVAVRMPELVHSLVSIMSNTGSVLSGQPALGLYPHVLTPAPRDRESFVEYTAKLFDAIGSPEFEADPDELREAAQRAYDRGHDSRGTARQLGAILKSGDRTSQLRRIRVPTLVMHGTRDRLVRPSGGRATARAIPGARLEMIEGMGHDLPRAVWPRIITGIEETARRADAERVTRAA